MTLRRLYLAYLAVLGLATTVAVGEIQHRTIPAPRPATTTTVTRYPNSWYGPDGSLNVEITRPG